MTARIWVALAMLLAMAACASPDRIILLPGEAGGETGAVAIISESGEVVTVVETAYTEARVDKAGEADTTQTDADAVTQEYGDLIQALPTPPRSFFLYFMEGTTTLVPESEPELVKLFEEVAARPGVDVQVTGHTDTVDSTQRNDRLSLARGEEIRQLLVDQGLDPALVRAVGRGERELLVETGDGVSEVRNRRVEVIVR
jgi:outer membrane protein OmpA-like peptidoglycan-associated protein